MAELRMDECAERARKLTIHYDPATEEALLVFTIGHGEVTQHFSVPHARAQQLAVRAIEFGLNGTLPLRAGWQSFTPNEAIIKMRVV